MPVKFKPKIRRECEIVPQGLSITKTEWSDNIYIRSGDTIARIRIAVDKVSYEVQTRES